MSVKQGDTITVDYTGTLEDGTVFDASEKHGQPMTFTVGEGSLIKGFENGVLGMNEGDTKKVEIPAAEAYGEPNEAYVQVVPRAEVGAIPDPKEGMQIGLRGPNGQMFPARIAKVTDDELTIDLNHPLAGKDLTFEITVRKIESGDAAAAESEEKSE